MSSPSTFVVGAEGADLVYIGTRAYDGGDAPPEDDVDDYAVPVTEGRGGEEGAAFIGGGIGALILVLSALHIRRYYYREKNERLPSSEKDREGEDEEKGLIPLNSSADSAAVDAGAAAAAHVTVELPIILSSTSIRSMGDPGDEDDDGDGDIDAGLYADYSNPLVGPGVRGRGRV